MHLLITMWGCIQCFHKLWEENGSWSCCKFKWLSLSMVRAHFQKDITSNIKIVKYLVMHAQQCISFAQFLPSLILHLEKKELKMPHPIPWTLSMYAKKICKHLSIHVLYHSPSIPLQILTLENFLDVQVI